MQMHLALLLSEAKNFPLFRPRTIAAIAVDKPPVYLLSCEVSLM